ncbi:non-hydrolyzing UDP-N-acetylglucosamine 2-epimerase [Alkalimarinus alittae]|uniref:UDP-N-acetylglucosamine 2-epimerase (Non-hydrolyzing) n=1 Tax=Alkalimarinus alittae TaxID=2961619 RepID=A0ABY6MZG9_9ALTE|nr:UDP-N-acetylglucosamine 2-epimerase (non-hydrolyzing) [Alkalimarinus alittae]UZE95152.1 UDP-N-acetylglucosamine 2-epimerase (non-hydrolyzing) [Alkalimarinus alittae]
MSLKILTVIGARPQFIKAATISRKVALTRNISEHIIHTGQHYDENMSGIFFDELDIPTPDVNLNIGSGLHGEQTAKMLIGIEQEIIKQKPSCVLVYGDTNSTLAGTLAATKLNTPVCHVEAGLRSFNRNMPEEMNRILTDHASDTLFAPTKNAVNQLRKEGVLSNNIILSGDVMFDAALYYSSKAEASSTIMESNHLTKNNYILATVHRAENTDNLERLTRIMSELKALAQHIKVVMPIHPRTLKFLSDCNISAQNILLLEPTGYLDMIKLERNSKLIITDSGGVQKEAFFHKKPCITLRTETEWVELVEAGHNVLFPPISDNTGSLTESVQSLTSNSQHSFSNSLYGDGHSAQLILSEINQRYG